METRTHFKEPGADVFLCAGSTEHETTYDRVDKTTDEYGEVNCPACVDIIAPMSDFDIVHLRLKGGRCVISYNGQGHLPCDEHN